MNVCGDAESNTAPDASRAVALPGCQAAAAPKRKTEPARMRAASIQVKCDVPGDFMIATPGPTQSASRRLDRLLPARRESSEDDAKPRRRHPVPHASRFAQSRNGSPQRATLSLPRDYTARGGMASERA